MSIVDAPFTCIVVSLGRSKVSGAWSAFPIRDRGEGDPISYASLSGSVGTPSVYLHETGANCSYLS